MDIDKYITTDVLIVSIIIVLTVFLLLLLDEFKKRRLRTSNAAESNTILGGEPSEKPPASWKFTAFTDRYNKSSVCWIVKVGKFRVNIAYVLFAIILLIGIGVRVHNFGANPPGLNQDEASGAYDAYCLATYGVDRNGDSFPVHFVAWGSGMNTLYAYISIPIIKLFGLTEVTASMGNLIFGILTLILLFFGVKIIKNTEVALASTFILAISPWHIMLSRWGLLENILPSIVMIGVFFCALSLKKPRWFLLCSLFMALSLYAYGTAYFVVPGILLFYGLYELYFFKDKRKWFFKYASAFLVFLIVSIPILLFIYINVFSPDSNAMKLGFFTIPKLVQTGTRYEQVVFLNSDKSQFFQTLLKNFGYYYDTVFKQNGVLWNVISEYGTIYRISNFFFIIGFLGSIIGLIRSFFTNKIRPDFIFLVWFILSTILGIVNETNTNRMNLIFIPMIYLTGHGICIIAHIIGLIFQLVADSVSTKLLSRIPIYSISGAAAIAVILVLYIPQFGSFSNYYFNIYPKQIGLYFQESFEDAILYTVDANPSDKTVYVSNFSEAYVYVLFYTKFSPIEFYNTVDYADPNAEFRPVLGFANYRFISTDDSLTPCDNCFYIVENDKVNQLVNKEPKRVERFNRYTVFEF